jgi:hypothetical protein
VNSTTTVNTSSLPIHIFDISTTLASAGMALKLAMGPIRLNPGPMLPKVVIDAVIEVRISIPIKEIKEDKKSYEP